MKKHFFVLIILFVIITSGCGITKSKKIPNVQNQDDQTKNTGTKVVTWCDKRTMDFSHETFHEGKLWISSEYYHGMNHAPTVRHLCREDKELFSLEMTWDAAAIHNGKLISRNSEAILPITSINKDPEIKLVEEQNKKYKNQVWFTIDEKMFMYDENTNKFIDNRSYYEQS